MVLSTIDEIAIEPDKKLDYSDRTTIDIKSESVGYEETPSILEWSEAEEKAIRRKIDWHTVPLTTVLYLLCFLDRSNIGNARIQGMAKDINLEGFRFNWVLSIFYIVYLFVEVPSNIVLKRREHRSDANEPVSLDHVKRAVFCIHNYTCAFGFFLINITVQGISVFMPTILNDLGWTATKAQLMSVPPYVVACASAVTVAYISDKTRQRGIYLALFSLIAVIGFAILRFETDANIRYMAVFFVTAGAFPGGPGFLSWAMNNSAGPSVRAVTSAYVVTIGTIGGIVATWTYTFKDAPKYFNESYW
ncbi:putative transporter [Colletotrichum sp. SAR 10_86]|nr:putative transporter [Colletotrichum sp. SAR 10_86]